MHTKGLVSMTTSPTITHGERMAWLETARAALLRAAEDAYEDAGVRGLCVEGRWECALAAIRDLDLRNLAVVRTRSDA